MEGVSTNRRTTSRTVVFTRPFCLSELDLPAGTYRVETEEEMFVGLALPADIRIATFLFVPGRGSSGTAFQDMVTIDALELERAERRDALPEWLTAAQAPGARRAHEVPGARRAHEVLVAP